MTTAKKITAPAAAGGIVPTDGFAMLVDLARSGADITAIERLVALKERADENVARDAFNVAMAKFHATVPSIKKSSRAKIDSRSGASFGYSYTTLDEIAKTIRKPLAEVGLSFRWSTESHSDHFKVTCIVSHIAGHSVETSFSGPIDNGRMNAIQQIGSSITYGQRYSLISALGLTTCDDDDDASTAGEGGAVNAEQAANLSALCDDVGADKVRFLRWLKVEKFADIPAASFDRALAELEKKRKAS